MLDGWFREKFSPTLDTFGARLARAGVSANTVTYAAFATGAAGAAAIACQRFGLGLLLILVSRFGDCLDGAVSKVKGRTDFGGYLDIVLDFAFYGLVPLAFVIADPWANAVAGATLLAAFYANGASFLAYAVMAEKHGLQSDARGEKSLFFTTGLAEATETIAVFAALCLFPAWFVPIAYGFAAVTTYTAVSRIILARKRFR